MTWLRLLALVRSRLRDLPPPIEFISPEPVDDLRELRRLRGLVEIQRSTRENVMYPEFTKARRRP